jgi:predicted PurR-regulated permease PerM
MEIILPWNTIFKILFTAVMVAVFLKLTSFFMLLFLSMILATSLSPAVDWMVAKKIPKWAAQLSIAIILIAGAATIAFGVLPSIVVQITHLTDKLPELKTELENSIEPSGLRGQVHAILENPDQITGNLTQKMTGWVATALGEAYSFVLLLILAIYFMIDGDAGFEWFLAFFSVTNQKKIKKTAEEVRPIIFSYVMGQFVTCVLVAIYVFTVLQILHVPGALLLAAIAAVCDIVPVVGFITSISIGFLMGLTVSGKTGITVAICYFAYMMLENNFIAPKVYGTRMDLSKLAVLLSILIGGVIAGIPGMVVVLPLVASFTVIEKVWLKPYLGEQTVKEHEKQTGI